MGIAETIKEEETERSTDVASWALNDDKNPWTMVLATQIYTTSNTKDYIDIWQHKKKLWKVLTSDMDRSRFQEITILKRSDMHDLGALQILHRPLNATSIKQNAVNHLQMHLIVSIVELLTRSIY